MADEVKSVGQALALLGSQVTFKEESAKLAFESFVGDLVAEEGVEEDQDLGELTKAELVELAEAKGVDVSGNDTKAEIVAAIEEADAGEAGEDEEESS